MLLVQREAGARWDLAAQMGRFQRPAVGDTHLPRLTPGVSLCSFLSWQTGRAQVAFRGSWSTNWNAWCSRVKGLLVQDWDLAVYRASGNEVPASHPHCMDVVKIRGLGSSHLGLLEDKAFTHAS